jgi:hypothetical protein
MNGALNDAFAFVVEFLGMDDLVPKRLAVQILVTGIVRIQDERVAPHDARRLSPASHTEYPKRPKRGATSMTLVRWVELHVNLDAAYSFLEDRTIRADVQNVSKRVRQGVREPILLGYFYRDERHYLRNAFLEEYVASGRPVPHCVRCFLRILRRLHLGRWYASLISGEER